MQHAPDLLLISQYDPELGEVAAFEELIGSHGGLGGPQNQPFILYPSEWTLDEPVPIGAPAIYRNLRAWLASIGIELGPRRPTTSTDDAQSTKPEFSYMTDIRDEVSIPETVTSSSETARGAMTGEASDLAPPRCWPSAQAWRRRSSFVGAIRRVSSDSSGWRCGPAPYAEACLRLDKPPHSAAPVGRC